MKKLILLLSISVFLISGCTTVPLFYLDKTNPHNPELFYFSGPPVLYDTDRLVRTPGFWISRHPDPYTRLLSPEQIQGLNSEIREKTGAVKDFTALPEVLPGEKLVRHLEDIEQMFVTGKYYLPSGRLKKQKDIQAVIDNVNIDSVPEMIPLKCGLMTTYTDQRLLPSSSPLYSIKGELDFDALQNSALDIGEPVVVAHYSGDREWAFVYGLRSIGWVPVKTIAFCTKEELLDFMGSNPFVVLISAKNELFYDKGQRDYCEYTRMGVRLPLAEDIEPTGNIPVVKGLSPDNIDETVINTPPVENDASINPGLPGETDTFILAPSPGDTYAVIIPSRDGDGKLVKKKVFIPREHCSVGYVPYTPAHMIKQAFKLLNAPFGWGGMYGEQDCSRFICGIFATAGIIMPRNSRDQSDSGIILGEFDRNTPLEMKENILDYRAIGGVTTLYQPGHIMLYLGMYENKPYVIHTLWAIARNIKGKDVSRVMNRTIVSTLLLSETSAKGSYLKRLRKISLIDYSDKGRGDE